MSRAARRIMAPAMSRSCCPLRVVAWLALLVAAPLVAQEPPPAAPPAGAVRVVVVRGSGELQDDRQPEVAPGLAPYAEQLSKLELARYELLGQSEQKGADPSVPLRFELPLGLRLEARPPAADAPPPRPEDAAAETPPRPASFRAGPPTGILGGGVCGPCGVWSPAAPSSDRPDDLDRPAGPLPPHTTATESALPSRCC